MKYYYLFTLLAFSCLSITGKYHEGIYITAIENQTSQRITPYVISTTNSLSPHSAITESSPLKVPDLLDSTQIILKVGQHFFKLNVQNKHGSEKIVLQDISRSNKGPRRSTYIQRYSGQVIKGKLTFYPGVFSRHRIPRTRFTTLSTDEAPNLSS